MTDNSFIYVYIIRNIENGKVYVGQSKDPHRRCTPSNYAGRIKEAITEYGEDAFEKIIIRRCDSVDDADKWEESLISFFNASDKNYGYNKATGGRNKRTLYGENNGFYGKRHSEGTIRKLRESHYGGNNANAKAVVCITTGQVFPSAREASDWCGASRQHICRVCNGLRKHTGKHPETGEPLEWGYYNNEI